MDLHAVEIEINHSCNRSCSYCPNSILERKTKGVMNKEIFSLILARLEEAQFAGRMSFHFYNEPLLHPDLKTFVEMAKRALPRIKIHLYSNGTLMTKKAFEELQFAGVDEFTVTRHEQDAGNKKYTFEETWNLLSDEQKTKVNYENFRDIRLVNRGGLLPHLGPEGLKLHPCHLPTHMISITVDGRVLSCFEDYNENLIFGDLKTKTLSEIWDDRAYTEFRSKLKTGLRHQYKPCSTCNRRESLPPFQ